jgi:hypothetical protein
MLSLYKTLQKNMVLMVLDLFMAIHQLNGDLKVSQKISWSIFLTLERRQNLKENMWYAQNTGKGGNLFASIVSVKQGCVQMDVSGATIQTSTSYPVALCSRVYQCPDVSSETGILSQFMMAD